MSAKILIPIAILFLILQPLIASSSTPSDPSKIIYESRHFTIKEVLPNNYIIQLSNRSSYMQITNHNFAIITPNNYYEILFPEQASIEVHGNTIIIKYGNIIHTFKPIEYGHPVFNPRKRVVKWNITLQKPSDLSKLSFSLSLITKIKPLLLANNSLLHLPADNITFGRIIAYDAEGNQFNFTYKLTDSTLILTPPLNITKAIFPLIIDPEITFGNEYIFNNGVTYFTSTTKLTSDKFVVAYQDYDNSHHGTAVVGEVSGDTITFGNEYVFNPANTEYISVSALTSDKIIIAYRDSGNSGRGTAIIGTVSDNTITFGSEYVFNSDSTYRISTSALTSDKFVITYEDYSNNKYGTAIIGTVSGTTITFGSEYVFRSTETTRTSVDTLTSNKFVVAYGNSSFQAVRIGEVSGTTITWGPEYTFSPCTYGISVTALDSNHIVVARKGESEKGIAVVGTVSGNTISFSSEVVFHDGSLYESPEIDALDGSHVVIAFNDRSDYKGKAIIGTVSGSSISFGSAYTFNPATTYHISVSSLTSSKFVVAYKDSGNDGYGTAIIGEVIPNQPPTISNPQPANNSANVPVTLSQLSVDISDPDGDLMDWTIETSPNIGSSSGNNAEDGTITCPVSGLQYGTTYTWYVNVTDSHYWTNETYTFTTATPQPPSNLKATSINTTTISLSWTKSPDTDTTVVVRKEGSYPTSVTDGVIVYNGTAESYVDSDLSPGTAYYYRAWSWAPNSYSPSYAQDMNYTYPDKPTSISSSATGYTISLYWNRGDGADYTVIRYSTSGYPSSLSEGTLAYNGTDTSTTVSGLNPNTTYYFSFWAYDSESGFYSQNYATCVNKTLDVPPDPSNLVATPVNTTVISLSWDADTNYRSVLVRKTTGYPTSPTDGTIIYNGTGTSYVDTGLSISTHYYYAVWTYKEYSHLYSEGHAQDDAWTYPQPPQDVDYTLESSGTTANLTITWTKGQGADKTVIRKSANSFPSSPSDGILVYNGTGESYTDANIDQMWYYRLWSYNEESGLYSEGVNLTFFACWLNCYNETTGEAISNWSVFISDMNGSQVYTAENLQNSHILNSSQLPQGLVSFKFTADGYKFRLYYYEITSEKSLTINAYLPPESANLYMLYVKDVFGSPVRGALISVRHYNPASDTYVEVARLYTDAEGRAGVYLVPGDMYKIVISKEGYQTGHSDFTPLAELYTAEFTLLGSGEGVELPEGLWDNITLSIRPSQTHFNESTNLTVYFNISCSSGELEWYRIEVYKIRNLTQTETLLYSKSESNPYGGNLSYNIGSEVGTYKVVCTFKKQNFSAVSFERDYYIYEEKLPSMSIIPPHVYVIILIFLALAAMAFLMRLGAGDLSPIAGIIVFIIGFLIYPVTIAGVSCWYLVIAMGIGYGAYMLVRSGV